MNYEEAREQLETQQEQLEGEMEKQDTLDDMKDYSGEDKVISSEQAKELLEGDRNTKLYTSEIPSLDSYIEGFEGGDLVVVSAPTKHGKTTFCQTLTENFDDKDITSLWFSYELRRKSFLDNFRDPLPYFALPKELSDNSTEWIEKRIVEAKAKFGAKMVFIDHLHYLMSLDEAANKNISLLLGGIMRELKKIAVKWNVTIFTIAHTKKMAFDSEPELSDVRDSSFISQESDYTFLMWRPKKASMDELEDYTILKVAANRRNGNTGTVRLEHDNGHFYESTKSAHESE